MQLTKLGHSCVLIETEKQAVLFDAGIWSDIDVNKLERLDQIVYTHEHGDHFDIDFLKSLIAKFPQAQVICNDSIKVLIEEAGVDVQIPEESECLTKFESPHEKLPIPGAVAPSENGYHFKDLFSHPGDSHSFNESKRVLAVPFVAPWGKPGDGVDKVLELKPEYVLPIHDWFFTDEAREWLDGLLESALEGSGITLLSSKPGVVHQID